MVFPSTPLGHGAAPCEEEPMLPVDDDDDIQVRIPDLAIYKILTRLPPSSVTRFKVICKSWFSMIASPSFARDHAAPASHPPGPSILLFDGTARIPATVVDENSTTRLGLRRWRAEPREGYAVQNCCGSVACLRTGNGGAELLNPATGEALSLGHGRDRDSSTRTEAEQLPWYCLGRCPSTGEYKVVRLDVRLPYSSPPHVTCEVCALGRGSEGFSSRWQEVGVWNVNYCLSGRGVHVDGVVYYLVEFVYNSVVCFDLTTHELRHMDLPVIDGVVASLSELDGRLCASLVPSGGASCREGGRKTMDVWVLDEDGDLHGGRSWVRRYSFKIDGTTRYVPRPLLLHDGKMLMNCADGSLCNYDVEACSGNDGDGAAEEVMVFEHKGRLWRLSGVTADVFVESLHPLRTILRA